ncbi:MAG TPA: efflux transporter outer membrane subunit [Candidatus Binatia bacterium]|nr:efflux transporter outer membrane subunit [Candidatus Binatia bacterium]
MRDIARRAWAVGAFALALGGCMIGPSFKSPPATVADAWPNGSDPAVDTARQEYRDWWRVFDDPVLDRLIELAYAQNLPLRMAGVRVLQSRAQLGLAIGELYPQQQQLVASYSVNRIPASLPYNIVNNTYQQAFLGAQAAWEIDLWGKVRRAIESADNAFLASVADYDDVLVTLTGDVASTYVQIRTLERRIAIARDNVAKQREALRIASNRFRGGVVSQRDVFQAENSLGETEAAIPALTIELDQSKNALALLLGMPPGEVDQLLGASSEIPVAPPRIAVGIPAELLRRRPDIRKAQLSAAAQCSQIGVAKADLLPALTLVGNVGTLSSDVTKANLGDLFSSKSLTYGVGPTLQWSILNYGQITNNVRVQDARFQELLIDYQNAVLSAQKEVANGMSVFLRSRDQVVYLQQSAQAAEGALTVAMNQYTQGIADFTTVLVAEQNLYQADDNLAVARGNVPLGLIAAYRALGGGWQIREGREIVPADIREEMEERTNWGTLATPDLLTPAAPPLPGPEDTGPTVRPPEW